MLNNKLTYACGAFHVLTIAYLLWLTLLPVEVRWAEADFLLLCGSMAFAIMPNRIYPLYQLMLLYEETGDSVKMSAMAQRVLRTKCKVESPATREMKEKAKERLTIKERRLNMRK